jgi:hypothetical protein
MCGLIKTRYLFPFDFKPVEPFKLIQETATISNVLYKRLQKKYPFPI